MLSRDLCCGHDYGEVRASRVEQGSHVLGGSGLEFRHADGLRDRTATTRRVCDGEARDDDKTGMIVREKGGGGLVMGGERGMQA